MLLAEKLPRIRYQLWNGKSQAALERIGKIYCATKPLLGVGPMTTQNGSGDSGNT